MKIFNLTEKLQHTPHDQKEKIYIYLTSARCRGYRHFHEILSRHSSVKNELLQMLMIFIYNVYMMTEFIYN